MEDLLQFITLFITILVIVVVICSVVVTILFNYPILIIIVLGELIFIICSTLLFL